MILRGKRLASSYSQIERYQNCPYSWYLNYVKKLRLDVKAKALEYGLAVHETMEYFFTQLKLDKKPTLEEMLNVYYMMFEIHSIPFDTEEEKEFNLEAGRVAVQRLYTPVSELDKLMINATVLGVEMPIEVEIEIPEYEVSIIDEDGVEHIETRDKVYIIGFIDLVLRTDEGIIIIDHKSGKTLFDKMKLGENLQFPIYTMAIEKEYGELPVKCYYNFTKLHKYQTVDITEKRLADAKLEIVKVFKKMGKPKDKQYPHTPKPSFMCYWCDFGKHNGNICKRSSDFKPKTKK